MAMGEAAPAERRGFLLFLVVLAVLCGLYLGRALVGETFVSTDLVHRNAQPWRGLEAALPPAHNENLADQPTVWLPMQACTREVVRDWLSNDGGGGEPPLYCPQSYCGAPWLGNMSSALFSPFTWLFVVLPFAPAFAICAAAKWLLAGIGTWLLARRLGIGPAGRLLAGVVFAFCGFQVVWIDSCLTNVSVFAPWLLLAIERTIERPSAGRTALLALVSWEVLVGGHPETSFWVAVGGAAFALCRWLALPRPPAVSGRRRASLLALLSAALLAGLLAVVQWWPFLEYALHSFGRWLRDHSIEPRHVESGGVRAAWISALLLAVILGRRSIARGGAVARAGGGGILLLMSAYAASALAGWTLRRAGFRPTLLLELLPDFYGRSVDGGSYGGPLTYHDMAAGFCGSALFLLAAATAFVRMGEGRVVAVALAGLAVGVRIFRVPLVGAAFDATKALATLGSSRALCVVALALALLGGFAVDELCARPRRLAASAFGFLLFLVGVGLGRDQSAAELVETGFTRLEGAALELPADLADPGRTGSGAEIRGRAPRAAERVKLFVDGVEKGSVATAAPDADGLRAFSWRWVGSHRIEEGGYRIAADLVRADGSTQRFDAQTASVVRPARPGPRWALHLGAAAAVLLAALAVSSAALRVATLLVATVVELAFFGARYNETTPVDRLPRAVDPIPFLAQKKAELGPLRALPMRSALHPNLHLLVDVDVLRGYDALEPLAYVQDVQGQLYRGGVEVPWFEIDFSTLDLARPLAAQLLDVLNVRYLLSEESPDPACGFTEVWRRGALKLFENPDALPRAFAVQRGLRWRDPFPADLRSCAVWLAGDELEFAGAGRVVAFDHARGRIRATVESDAGTILVVSENAAGWRATIDGADAPIRTTHGSFLSVVLPDGGRHEVELRYRPRSVELGARISGGGALLLLALAVAARLRRPAAAVDRSAVGAGQA